MNDYSKALKVFFVVKHMFPEREDDLFVALYMETQNSSVRVLSNYMCEVIRNCISSTHFAYKCLFIARVCC